MTEKHDVIVIGAGVIGACVAFEFAKTGKQVLCVDKLPASGYGSTSNSCAIIRFHYSTFDGVAFAREGYYYWDDWANYLEVEDERGLAKFNKCGCVFHKTAANKDFLKRVCANLDDLKIPWEDMDTEAWLKKMPAYDGNCFAPVRLPNDPQFGEKSGETMGGALFIPDSGYISDPQLSTHNVQRAAEAKGAKFLFNAEVKAIRQADGRVAGITLADGAEHDAPVVVNVAGPHSYLVNRMADVEKGMKITTRALRQEVAHVPKPEGVDFSYVTSDNDIGVYCRPETGDHILIGSEDPECDEREWVDPDDFNRDFSDQWTAQVYRFAQRLPSLGIPSKMKGVVDLYDVTDDWIPIYDKSDLPGFYMAVGTSGNQYKNAPVAGKMMTALIEACEAGHDHDADPVQFHLENIDRTISVGFYSRLREIVADSTFSVLG